MTVPPTAYSLSALMDLSGFRCQKTGLMIQFRACVPGSVAVNVVADTIGVLLSVTQTTSPRDG